MENSTCLQPSTVYDRLMKLNILEHAFEEWDAYRATVTDYILLHTRAGGTALIVGAGACNDLDMVRLKAHFSSLTLADIDMDAMKTGLLRQNLTDKEIKPLQADIIGIDQQAIREFSAFMEKAVRDGAKCLTESFLKEMQRLFQSRVPCPFYDEARFDHVIVMGVHSQLLSIFPRIAGVFSRAGFVDLQRIEAYVSSLNDVIMPEVNEKLLKMSRVGTLFGLETERQGIPGGIEGARQAADDLLKSGYLSLDDTEETIWPFDAKRGHVYRVLLAHTR